MDWNNRFYQLEVDITSNCNAKCGGCMRNLYGGDTIEGLPLDNFSVELWNRFINEDIDGKEIITLELNGGWGDPCNHPNLPEMLETFCKKFPSAVVFMTTNGGFQSPAYWEALASVLKQYSYFHRIDFNIDGLADTNHIFRRNTDFNKIMENLKAFNAAGGNSGWKYHVFDYNKHQIDTARTLAKDIGCMEFSTKRLNGDGRILVETSDETYNVTYYDIDDVEYDNWQFIDDAEMMVIFEKLQSLKIENSCPWFAEGQLHIDPWGFVWPCKSMGSFTYNDDPRGIVVDDMFDEYGYFNNLNNSSLNDILNHEWFTEVHERAVTGGRWEICREECDACGSV